LQSQTRITASVVVPTLTMDREPQVKWAIPVTHKIAKSTSFQFSPASNPPSIITAKRNIQRIPSTSLPDFPIKLQRTQPVRQS
jgi:hypothetical protein